MSSLWHVEGDTAQLTDGERNYIENYYELCYLYATHEYIAKSDINTVITGLSYGLDDFETRYMRHRAANLSMHSQDLYYDRLNIEKACAENRNIKNVVMTLGYYSLFYDTSLSSNKTKCIETYLPLFGDTHHFNDQSLCSGRNTEVLTEHSDGILRFFGDCPEYYGDCIEREITNIDVYRQCGWYRLSPNSRFEIAKALASKHNNHINHLDTYRENTGLLTELFDTLNRDGINIFVVIPPFSPEYNAVINNEYIKYLLEYLEAVPFPINYIDMNEMGFDATKYFMDADHLNLRGAIEASRILDALIDKTSQCEASAKQIMQAKI